MTTTTEATQIAIAMSERRPLRVDPVLWPTIARVFEHDGKVACQANREWTIMVRQHADGRRIVYGKFEAGGGGMPTGFRGSAGGFFVEARDGAPDEVGTVRAIRRVAGIIHNDALGDECIAALPAEELK